MKRSIIVLSLLVSLVLVAAVGQVFAKSITLRYAHVGVKGAPQTRYAEELAAMIEERTEGRVKVQVFPNSQLGNISEMVDGVKTGSISMAHHDFASVGKLLPEMSVFNAPYIYRNDEHAVKATNPITSPVLKELNNKLVKEGNMRVIGSFYRGARQLSAKFPVYSPEDLKGKKIRGVPFKLWNSMLTGMGAIPTPVEITELTTALMTGLVSGQENPLTNIYAHKFHEVQTHIMMTSHMQSILCTFINEKIWQSIPEKDREIIQTAMTDMANRSLQWARESKEEMKEILTAEGITFIEEKDGLDLDAFRTSVLEQINKDFPEWRELIKEIQSIE